MSDKKQTPPPAATTPKKPRGLDRELQAMARIDRILAELDGDETKRVIEWLRGRNSRKMYGYPEPSQPEGGDVAPKESAA